MIVALSGKITSGKSTVAKIWQLLDVYYNTVYYKTHKDKKSNIEFVLDSIGKDHFIYNEYSGCCDLGVNGVGYVKYNSNWEQKSFAHKLKQVISIITGCKIENLENEEFKNSKLSNEWEQTQQSPFIGYYDHTKFISTYRQALQFIGADLFRNQFHPNTWTNALFSDYQLEDSNYKFKNYPDWLITDCRFKNEAKAITDRSGVIIRVNRDTNNKDNHPSETELDNYPFEYIIDNNGSIEELIEKVKVIMIDLGIIKDERSSKTIKS